MSVNKESAKEVQGYKNAVIYARVARHQGDGDSLGEEENECRAYADEKGLTITRVFSEIASGLAEEEREALREMFEFIADEKNKVSAVIVSGSDRLSRDAVQYWRISEELNRLGVRLIISLKSLYRV